MKTKQIKFTVACLILFLSIAAAKAQSSSDGNVCRLLSIDAGGAITTNSDEFSS